jgi:uncharacterized membrane protein
MIEAEDRELYIGVQRTLVVGMAISFGLMGLGLGGLVLDPTAAARAGQVLPLDRILAALGAGDPVALLDLGVLALMFIPVVHLTVALVNFARRREARYVAAAAVVLGLLALSAALALLRR